MENSPKSWSCRILMVHNKDFNAWTFPGGYVEANSSSDKTAARELYEEAALKCELSNLIPCMSVSGYQLNYPSGDTVQPYMMVYLTQKWHETSTELDETEISERKWFTIEEAKQLELRDLRVKMIEALESYLATKTFQILDLSK